jgi:hypothetical protein
MRLLSSLAIRVGVPDQLRLGPQDFLSSQCKPAGGEMKAMRARNEKRGDLRC